MELKILNITNQGIKNLKLIQLNVTNNPNITNVSWMTNLQMIVELMIKELKF